MKSKRIQMWVLYGVLYLAIVIAGYFIYVNWIQDGQVPHETYEENSTNGTVEDHENHEKSPTNGMRVTLMGLPRMDTIIMEYTVGRTK